MPRYIDADALREEINSLSVTLCGKELFGELAKYSVLQKIDEAPTADVTDINDGHKSEWISVDERLPEETCECLVIDAVGVIYLVKYSGRYRAFNAIDCDDGDRWKLNNVTHWMPMPEPPITDKPTQE